MFNENLAGRFNRFAQKHFSMKGREGVPTVSADLQLNLSCISGVENFYLQGWDIFSRGTRSSAPGAGVFSQFQIRNPIGSGVVAVIMRLALTDPTAGTLSAAPPWQLQFNNTIDQNTLQPVSNVDARGRPSASVILSNNTAAITPLTGTLGNTVFLPCHATANDQFELLAAGTELPLLPGTTLFGTAVASNTSLGVQLIWRERALEDSEKF